MKTPKEVAKEILGELANGPGKAHSEDAAHNLAKKLASAHKDLRHSSYHPGDEGDMKGTGKIHVVHHKDDDGNESIRIRNHATKSGHVHYEASHGQMGDTGHGHHEKVHKKLKSLVHDEKEEDRRKDWRHESPSHVRKYEGKEELRHQKAYLHHAKVRNSYFEGHPENRIAGHKPDSKKAMEHDGIYQHHKKMANTLHAKRGGAWVKRS